MTAVGLGGGAVAEGAKSASTDPVGTFDQVHGTVTKVLDNADKVKAVADRAKGIFGEEAFNSALTWAATQPLPVAGGGVIAAGAAVAIMSHQIIEARLDDHRTGATA